MKSLVSPHTNNEKSEREFKETIPFIIETKRIKYLGINLPKGKKTHEWRKWKDTNERNQRWHKQMDKYNMFLDRKNQYSENEYTTQNNLQFHTITIKLPMTFFIELEENILQLNETQKDPE